MAVDIQALMKRDTRLRELRRTWEPTWQELTDYILPRKNDVIVRRTPGRKKTQQLFDSTSIHANELLASSMQGSLTSAAVKWFRLKTRDQALNDVKVVAEWLDEVADRMYLALQQSNFNSEIQEVYLDLGSVGTGALLLDEGDKSYGAFGGLRFKALQVGTYCISEDDEGRVNTIILRHRMPVSAVSEWFGKQNLGEKLTTKLERDPDDVVDVAQAVYPRGTKGSTAKKQPYASVYFYADDKHILRESGYYDFPVMVPRWSKASGEIYGRGPGYTALPDIRTLNAARKLTLKAWAKSVDPAMLVKDDGVIGAVKLGASDVTTVRDLDAIRPFESKARFDVGKIEEEQLRTSIRDIFFNSQLQLPNGPIMTATEVERRYELMQRVLGPTLGRLESELLAPLIERVFGMMMRKKQLPPPPPDVIQANADIDIEYEGPLARAQRSSDVQAVGDTLQIVGPVVQLHPEAIDVIDVDGLVRWVAQRKGVPSNLIRDAGGVQDIRTARQQAQAQTQQTAQGEQFSKMARNAAPFLKAVAPDGLMPQTPGQQPNAPAGPAPVQQGAAA